MCVLMVFSGHISVHTVSSLYSGYRPVEPSRSVFYTHSKNKQSWNSVKNWAAAAAGLLEYYLTHFNLWVRGWGVRGWRSCSQYRWLRCIRKRSHYFHNLMHKKQSESHVRICTERNMSMFLFWNAQENTNMCKDTQKEGVEKVFCWAVEEALNTWQEWMEQVEAVERMSKSMQTLITYESTAGSPEQHHAWHAAPCTSAEQLPTHTASIKHQWAAWSPLVLQYTY